MSSLESISSELKAVPIADEIENVVLPYKTCTITGEGNEFVVIGDHKYYRHELMQAFGGTFNPGLAPYPKHSFGNPAAIGLVSTGMNILIFDYSLPMQWYSYSKCWNWVMYVYGRVGRNISWYLGVLCWFSSRNFVLTVFTSYGAFWLSFGAIFIPSFGIIQAYEEDPEQLNHAIGLMLIGGNIYHHVAYVCCPLYRSFGHCSHMT